MANDIKVIKGNSEMTINETQLENFEKLGYKLTNIKDKSKKKDKENKWQHITEKKEL